ncbi:MAG: hypothetical protein PHE43_04250 [Candidatus Nanoarchaeia archaeon]|nr:hypothetical protein [Candidatus Nanoarchaeia archaeon]
MFNKEFSDLVEGYRKNGWHDENGSHIHFLPGFSLVFTNDNMRDLNRRYAIYTAPTSQVPSSMGSASMESVAVELFKIYRIYNSFVGLEKIELEEFLNKVKNEKYYVSRFLGSKFLESKLILGAEVVFPTEELLENQGLKTYEKLREERST